MRSVKNALYKLISEQKIAPMDAMLIFNEIENDSRYLDDDIAVIGMSGRLPGAKNPEEYWQNLKGGLNCITEIPPERQADIETVLTQEEKKLEYRKTGFLDEIDKFDAAFFRISPKEAKLIEPEQRLFMEVAWEAIEDAGYPDKVYGTQTGVYVGRDHVSGSMYKKYTGGLENPDTLALTGVYPAILPSRLSYMLNLKGPSIVFDTACSSGLVAVHKACQALKNRECDMVIAGGVNLQLRPFKYNSFKMVETESDVVRTFDKNSTGTAWGEGVCAFILKPLSKALEDRDNIHAVIKGSAINNDGVSSGITAPNAEAQESVIVKAWEEAKIDIETISYIEAHGTGTVMGDPVEVKALKNAFSRFTTKKQFCGIGSLKPSIGHLVSASGPAALLKVILSMKHKEIPATINFIDPNPYINFADSQVYVNDRLQKWEVEGHPRRAGISSFGFSGTNCHMIVEEAPEMAGNQVIEEEPCVLALSAKNSNALKRVVDGYRAFLDKNPSADLKEICYTANTGRCHYEYRLALVCGNKDELKTKLELASAPPFDSNTERGIFYGAHRIVNRHSEEKNAEELTHSEKQQLDEYANMEIDERLTNDEAHESILHILCSYYVKGADIKWQEHIYKGESIRKISLPHYPFEKTKLWCVPEALEENVQSEEINEQANGEMIHPLLGYRLADNMLNTIYRNELSPKNHWGLREHIVLERGMLVGTSYIEMARAACEKYFNSSSIEFRDVLFLRPFTLDPDEVREIQTNIGIEDGYVEFVICGRNEDAWEKYAEGKAYRIEEEKTERYDMPEIAARCLNRTDGQDIKEKIEGAEFGPRWKNIVEVHSGSEEIIARLKLPEEFYGDMEAYYLHPSLMDNAVNILIRLNERKGHFLPFSYRSLKVYDKMPGEFYSYITNIRMSSDGNKLTSMDIKLTDINGYVFAEIKDYSTMEINGKEYMQRRWDGFFETAWIQKRLNKAENIADNGTVMVFEDDGVLGGDIIAGLREKGRNVISVSNNFVINGEEKDYNNLLGEVRKSNVSQIIHLGSIRKERGPEDITTLEENQKRGIFSLLYMVKGLVSNAYVNPIDLVCVSDYANLVDMNEARIYPHNTALFGMGKVVSMEYDNLKCRCIDVDDQVSAQMILEELSAQDNDYIVAYRGGKRYVEEFRRFSPGQDSENTMEVRERGTYIITGGMGAIGLEICKYLASRNMVNLCLINRTPVPGREKWDEILSEGMDKKLCNRIQEIRSIEETGSRVMCYSADVSKEEEIKAVLEDIRAEFGRINGVFHCAGVAGDGFIIRKSEEAFNNVVDPKVKGTWLLDKLTEKDTPDVFVLFSSVYTLMGGPGQSDYCAANSYLDSFGAYRKMKAGKTVTINWPGWKETGMALEHGLGESSGLFKTITTSDAISKMDAILNSNAKRIIVGEFDFEALGYIKEGLRINFSTGIRQLIDRKTRQTGSDKRGEGRKTVRDVTIVGKEKEELTEIEITVGNIWASIIEIDEINIHESFYNMGGDSILATQVVKELGKEYPGIVIITDIFNHPTVAELSNFISEQINKPANGMSEEDLADQKLKEMLDSIELGDITEDIALDLLDGMRGGENDE